jgi:CyaY protein
MPDSGFVQRGAATLRRIQDALDQAVARDDLDCDCELEGSVLRVNFNDGSRIVINLQPAVEEVWVASRRGGYHFRANAEGQWADTRDGCELGVRLSEEIAHHAGVALRPDSLL